MRKVILLAVFIAACASVSFAQNRPGAEGYAGFSVSSMDTRLADEGFDNASDRQTGLGFEGSVTGYFTNRFGLEGNVDGHFRRQTVNFSFTPTSVLFPVRESTDSFNFTAGPHVRFPSVSSRTTPFLHALAGVNHTRFNANPTTAVGSSFAESNNSFTLKLGGGVDFGMTTRTALRLTGDYNPIFERNRT